MFSSVSVWIFNELLILILIVIDKTLTQSMIWIQIEGVLTWRKCIVLRLQRVATTAVTSNVRIAIVLLTQSKITISHRMLRLRWNLTVIWLRYIAILNCIVVSLCAYILYFSIRLVYI